MYKVIKAFTDLQDGNHVYHSGEIFPRKGAKASQERIAELSGDANKVGYPLIAEITELEPNGEPKEEEPEEKPVKKTTKRTSKK